MSVSVVGWFGCFFFFLFSVFGSPVLSEPGRRRRRRRWWLCALVLLRCSISLLRLFVFAFGSLGCSCVCYQLCWLIVPVVIHTLVELHLGAHCGLGWDPLVLEVTLG